MVHDTDPFNRGKQATRFKCNPPRYVYTECTLPCLIEAMGAILSDESLIPFRALIMSLPGESEWPRTDSKDEKVDPIELYRARQLRHISRTAFQLLIELSSPSRF